LAAKYSITFRHANAGGSMTAPAKPVDLSVTSDGSCSPDSRLQSSQKLRATTPHCVLDVPVPEIVLHRARVLPVIGELVPARMTQHVRMHRERKLPALPCSRDHLAVSRDRDRRRAFGKYKSTFDFLALEPTQRAQLTAARDSSSVPSFRRM
jgi:hypothetical protein